MNKFAVLLKDGTEIAVDEATIAPSFVVNTASKEAVMEIWDQLTTENLAEIRLKKDDVVVGTFYDATVENVQILPNPGGTTTAHFYLNGGAASSAVESDAEYVQAAKILLGEEEA